MNTSKLFYSSVTRISDVREVECGIEPAPRAEWALGDYVVGRVAVPPRGFDQVESSTGRMAQVYEGDLILGAFGDRCATLEAVGSWRDIGDDGRMDLLTSAGLFGRATSVSQALASLVRLEYAGHAVRDGRRLVMSDFVREVVERPYTCDTVMIVGTSMSAGKTTSAKVVVRQLKRMGLRVAGVKLTGAGRYRDILSMRDAGADVIFDFVDVGLPSTVIPAEAYGEALRKLLSMVSAASPDVVVVEVGASPLEPYNGETALAAIRDHVRCTVLCASDPYAVVGVMQGFSLRPSLVAGVATSTSAGARLVERLTGCKTLDLLAPSAQEPLRALLSERLELSAESSTSRPGR